MSHTNLSGHTETSTPKAGKADNRAATSRSDPADLGSFYGLNEGHIDTSNARVPEREYHASTLKSPKSADQQPKLPKELSPGQELGGSAMYPYDPELVRNPELLGQQPVRHASREEQH